MLAETYMKHIPAEDAESGEIVFYGIKRIIEENTDYVPGANIHPLGLYILLRLPWMGTAYVLIPMIRCFRYTSVPLT